MSAQFLAKLFIKRVLWCFNYTRIGYYPQDGYGGSLEVYT